MKTLKTVRTVLSQEEIKGTYVLFRDLGAGFGEAVSGTYASVVLSANYLHLIGQFAPQTINSNLVVISEEKLFGRRLSDRERKAVAQKS
ncbi:MAG: hypothetical protein WCW67_00700 [Candidatus Margulisiibacteriota bacterium]|jgi:hypothetical protein